MISAYSAKYFHLHLISDSTGETIQAVARAVCAQFVDAQAVEHIYGLRAAKRRWIERLTL